MKREKINGLNLWQFDILAQQTQIRHFVTDRFTVDRGEEFTLSLSSHPDRQFVLSNREALAGAMKILPQRIVFPSQVHETRIVTVDLKTSKEDVVATDALITNTKGVCICVMSADCVPILLYDTRNNVVAAVHSGWRGTVARILEKTLNRMRSDFGTEGEDLLCGIGPSVSQESYEVGEEVIASVESAFGSGSDLLVFHDTSKAKLDLWKANTIQLLEFGVYPEQIEVSDLCTVKNNSYFFSARKGDSGRFAAGILLSES